MLFSVFIVGFEQLCIHGATFIVAANPSGIYFFKVSNGHTRTMCEICSNKNHGAFIIIFEDVSYIALLFPLLTSNI